jgi:hypothetical protein
MHAPRSTQHLRLFSALLGLIAFAILSLATSRADAYPWMIRHEYNNCIACHVDPSGGGMLTPYGRGQSQVKKKKKKKN